MHCIVASTSTIHGSDYLAYLKEPLTHLFQSVTEILFIPYARPGGISHDEYTQKATEGLTFLGKKVVGIHQKEDPIKALEQAEAIFTGGGNTFLLVSQLYKQNVLEPLRKAIKSGTPYLGTSAGSNICGKTMKNTNDMPIVYPPDFTTLGILPFNVNCHYLDPDPSSKHKGETRETRIKEFHEFNETMVIGLREGSWLEVSDHDIVVKGKLKARIFEAGQDAYEIETETSLMPLVQ